MEYTCECGETKAWIEKGEWTDPCPNCGASYACLYDKEKHSLVAHKYCDSPTIGKFIKSIKDTEIEGVSLSFNIGSYLPAPITQLMNKFKKKKNETVYTVKIELKEKEDE